jgi:hypothetical protein
MEALMEPFKEYNRTAKKQHRERYHPRFVFTLGNHENRINRATNADAKLDGTIGVEDLKLEHLFLADSGPCRSALRRCGLLILFIPHACSNPPLSTKFNLIPSRARRF